MKPPLHDLISSLERAPAVFRSLLDGASAAWVDAREHADAWSPRDIVVHLIDGEDKDWIPRTRIILEHGTERAFDSYDRHGPLESPDTRSLAELLDVFAEKRAANASALRGFGLKDDDLERAGTHPELGRVTLGELLACWTAHDYVHMAQATRTMARRLKGRVGPWEHPDYMPLLAR